MPVSGIPPSIEDLRDTRWSKGFGVIMSADAINIQKLVGYGGIYWVYLFYDPGHTPGYLYGAYLPKGADGTSVTAPPKQMKRHWAKKWSPLTRVGATHH